MVDESLEYLRDGSPNDIMPCTYTRERCGGRCYEEAARTLLERMAAAPPITADWFIDDNDGALIAGADYHRIPADHCEGRIA